MISLLILLLPAGVPQGHTEAFLEVSAPDETYFLHEPIPLRLRVGFERSFMEERLIQPFRRKLDVPARLELPWAGGLDCATAQPAAAGGGPTLALGDDVVSATSATTVRRDGREFAVIELERTLVPTCVGKLELAPGTLSYAFATRFDDDLLEGRVPADPSDAVVHGESLTLTILPLPEDGRPLDFTGAVGRFTLRAAVESPRVVAGESFALELTIAGGGDPTAFRLPRFDGLDAFRELGRVDNVIAGARVVTLDLVARDASVAAVPALAFSFFDPHLPGYVTAHSDPVALEVRPMRAAPTGTADTSEAPAPQDRRRWPVWLGLIALALGLAFALARRATRAREPGGPADG